MYCDRNFKTKKALKEAVAKGEQIGIFQPGPFSHLTPSNAEVSVEGPHYPAPHSWYARVVVKDGVITKVK